MLRHAISIAVLLAACSRAPDYSGCRLVGRWGYVFPDTKRSEEVIREQGRDPEQVRRESREKQRAEGTGESYFADGTYILRGEILDHPVETRREWRLVSEGE